MYTVYVHVVNQIYNASFIKIVKQVITVSYEKVIVFVFVN